ncbi:MAG: hypothetical protein LBG13_01090 [Holosporales bacterium]|jgi:hypothetical protein|nr:hypothetical protein [Holosporales bacterium]
MLIYLYYSVSMIYRRMLLGEGRGAMNSGRLGNGGEKPVNSDESWHRGGRRSEKAK